MSDEKTKVESHTDADEFTGVEAQRDNDFGVPGATQENLAATLEEGLDELGDLDTSSFESTISDKEKFLILPKRELGQFIRNVEPLTKSTLDQYGKSLLIRSESVDVVELVYVNPPYKIAMKVNNKSGKQIDPFCMNISYFKKLCTDTPAAVVIVQEDKETGVEYSTTVCDSLLFLETVALDLNEFKIERKAMPNTVDRETGIYVFKKLGSILNYADKTSEKVIVMKGDKCYFNTSIFSACVKSPFSLKDDMILYKNAIDILGVFLELSKVDVRYGIHGDDKDIMAVEADGLIYCEFPTSSKISDHYSTAVANALRFEATAVLANDTIGRLLGYAKSFEYLSNIVTLRFTNQSITLLIMNQNMSKTSEFPFNVVEGGVELEGEMKVSADVMKPYFEITGTDVKYSFNEIGLCMTNQYGNFIVRKVQ